MLHRSSFLILVIIYQLLLINCIVICRSFARNLETYKMLTRLKPPRSAFDEMGRGLVS